MNLMPGDKLPDVRLVAFENGKFWVQSAERFISGTTRIASWTHVKGLEDQHRLISQHVTGSPNLLQGIRVEYRGLDVVDFAGVFVGPTKQWFSAKDDPDSDHDGEAVPRERVARALMRQHRLQRAEVEHALNNLRPMPANEYVLKELGAVRELRMPAHPAECNYVRVTISGLQIHHWAKPDWQPTWPGSGSDVMGMILGMGQSEGRPAP